MDKHFDLKSHKVSESIRPCICMSVCLLPGCGDKDALNRRKEQTLPNVHKFNFVYMTESMLCVSARVCV